MPNASGIVCPSPILCQAKCPLSPSHTPANPLQNAPTRAPQVVLIVGILAVSTSSLFIRYAQNAGAASLAIAAYRLTFASLILLPLVLWRHHADLRALPRRAWAWAGVSGFFLGLHFATWISSLAYTSVASSVVLVDTAPLFVALIAVGVLRQQLARPLLLGLGIAFLGGLLVAGSDACEPSGCPPLSELVQGAAFWGDLLALAGAATVAVYLTIGSHLRQAMPLLVYIFLVYSSAALTLWVALWLVGQPAAGFATEAYGWFLVLAIIPQLLGHSSYNYALKFLPPTYVALTVLGEPIGSIGLAMLFLDEFPTPLKLVGCALILGGIGLAAQPVKKVKNG